MVNYRYSKKRGNKFTLQVTKLWDSLPVKVEMAMGSHSFKVGLDGSMEQGPASEEQMHDCQQGKHRPVLNWLATLYTSPELALSCQGSAKEDLNTIYVQYSSF